MNAISGFSGLLSEADDDEKLEYAEIIQKSAAQLLTLVDDVLLLSRLQSEKLPITYSQFSPAALVQNVSQLFQIPGQKSNLDFIVTIPEQCKNSVYISDENKITQVLTCLASNAIKYTPQGFIEIGFSVDNHQVEFFVKDSGIGISESDQLKIFDTFFRTEQAIALAIRGTGLGLNIARELVTLMGGTIGVTSQLGKGSRFFFTVPVEHFELKNHETTNHSGETGRFPDLNILVVDDEPINCQLIELLLRDVVGHIDFAFDGQEAVDKASVAKYDLVLMDIKMPVMGGLEATLILKARHPGIKIIAQTAFSLPEEQELAFQAGCDEVLTKPIIKNKLLEKISDLGF
jgi:CheY-like chemotaxis protein